MQGDKEIIEILNEVLTAELTAINQYFIHGKMCENWGYTKLSAQFRTESIDEMRDAEVVIGRILYLDGVPNMQRMSRVMVGTNVLELFELDIALERSAIERYNRGIGLAAAKGDNGTRELFETKLMGEEVHADWLETQLSVIDKIGLENYLAQQL